MKIVFFTFYFPPDLSAGSFRSIAFSQSLKERIEPGDKIDIITSHPNRYKAHLIEAQDVEFDEMITIHRINVPSHTGSMFSQGYAFLIFAISVSKLVVVSVKVFAVASYLVFKELISVVIYVLSC